MSLRYQARIVSGVAHTRNVFQRFTAEPFADLRQRGSLGISEPQPSGQMCSQDKVLGSQVLILQEQLLVYQPRYIRQQTCPVVVLHVDCIIAGPAESCSLDFLTIRAIVSSAGIILKDFSTTLLPDFAWNCRQAEFGGSRIFPCSSTIHSEAEPLLVA